MDTHHERVHGSDRKRCGSMTTATVSRFLVLVDVDADSGLHKIAVDHRDAAWRCVTCARGNQCKYLATARATAAENHLDPTEVIL